MDKDFPKVFFIADKRGRLTTYYSAQSFVYTLFEGEILPFLIHINHPHPHRHLQPTTVALYCEGKPKQEITDIVYAHCQKWFDEFEVFKPEHTPGYYETWTAEDTKNFNDKKQEAKQQLLNELLPLT